MISVLLYLTSKIIANFQSSYYPYYYYSIPVYRRIKECHWVITKFFDVFSH